MIPNRLQSALLVATVALIALTGCSDGTITVADVDVLVRYPDGWTEVPPSVVKSQLEDQLDATSGEVRSAFELAIKEIDSGVVRAVAFSPATPDGFTESVLVTIEEGDADLDAATARRVARMRLVAASIEVVETDVELPIGPARRVEAFSQPEGGSPSHVIEYIVLLADGRTFSLSGTGPSTDDSFGDTMDVMAQSLEAT